MEKDRLVDLSLSFHVAKDDVDQRFELHFQDANVCGVSKKTCPFSGEVFTNGENYIEGHVSKENAKKLDMLKDHTILEVAGDIRTDYRELPCKIVRVQEMKEEEKSFYLKFQCTDPYPNVA